jgi:threonine dehydrogenase-like Zn-dependent dehydrogenase
MTEKMKASVLVKPGVLEVQDVEVPEIGEEEVLVKVAYAGICGSDVPRANLENGARMYPLILGHEFSGTVDRVGSRVTKVHVGDKIAVAPLIPDPNSATDQVPRIHTTSTPKMHRQSFRVVSLTASSFVAHARRMRQATSCQTSPARPHNTDTATPDRYHTAPV